MIIQRDRFGYGLTVSGDNPVYVLSVRDGGAAHRAGINMNDQIIKVRPTVFHSTSLRVLYWTLYKTISKKTDRLDSIENLIRLFIAIVNVLIEMLVQG